jgi:lysozyme family protein
MGWPFILIFFVLLLWPDGLDTTPVVSLHGQHPAIHIVWGGDNRLGVSFRQGFIEGIVSFESALKKTLHIEGGLSLDPDDSGNWTGGVKGRGELKGTRYGISAAQYPNEDIRNITPERVAYLYKRDYWDAINLHNILNETLQEKLFDTAVNQGVKTAAFLLQNSINALQPDSPIQVDGMIGPVTLQAANQYTTGTTMHSMAFWLAFRSLRFMKYYELYMANPRLRKYRWSWLSRV